MIPRVTPFAFEDNPLQDGDYVNIQCSISHGDFPLNITWIFNGLEVKTKSGIVVTPVGKRSSSLTIDSVSHNHAGNYTCRGANQAGFAEYTATLMVNGSLKF